MTAHEFEARLASASFEQPAAHSAYTMIKSGRSADEVARSLAISLLESNKKLVDRNAELCSQSSSQGGIFADWGSAL